MKLNKKQALTLVRIVGSILGLGYVVHIIPLTDVWEMLKHTQLTWVVVLLILAEISVWQQAIRWRKLVVVSEISKPSMATFMKYTLIGSFFNLIMPTGFGGDAIKSIAMGKRHEILGVSIASTVISRIMGLIALIGVFGLAWIMMSDSVIANKWGGVMLLIGVCLCIMLTAAIYFAKHLWIVGFTDRFEVLKQVRLGLSQFEGRFKLLMFSFFDSIVIQLIMLLMQWILFRCVGADVPFTHVMLVFPVVTIATILPVSIYGVGVREVVSVGLYSTLGSVSDKVVLAAGVYGYVVVFFLALQGAWLFAVDTKVSVRQTA